MKKLLLLALVAFIGINAQAQGKPEVITEQPAGTETVYKRVSGKMFFVKDKEIKMADLGKLIQGGGKPGDLKVVTADDGKTVYLKYVIT